jgi:phosphoglycolate phosphatase
MTTFGSLDGAPVDAVLFDLDGTLLDTAADLGAALDAALAESGIEPCGEAAVRLYIGKGAPTLVARALASRQRGDDAALHAYTLERFFHHYGRLNDEGRHRALPYPGAGDCLAALHAAGLPLAVVTNKQHRFALALMQRLGWAAWLQAIVGGDTLPERKPHPAPLLHACKLLGAAPQRCLMVGDSLNDVAAAHAAGLRIICVPYGYNEGQDARLLPANGFVETLAELPARLGLHGGR